MKKDKIPAQIMKYLIGIETASASNNFNVINMSPMNHVSIFPTDYKHSSRAKEKRNCMILHI